ncbi:MAG: CAP domain-containing protein, partial [Sarcina sp.]
NVENTSTISKDNNIVNECVKDSSKKNNIIAPNNNDVKKETKDVVNSKANIKNTNLNTKAINNNKANSIKKSNVSVKKSSINSKKESNVKKVKAISKPKITKNETKPVSKVTINNTKRNTKVTQPKVDCPKKNNSLVKHVSNCNNKNTLTNNSTNINAKNNNAIVKEPITNSIKNDDSKKNNSIAPVTNNTKNNEFKNYNSNKNESIIKEKTNDIKNIKNNEPSLDDVQQAIFKIVNRERAKHGKSPLSYDKTMEKYAIMKSKDMITRNYFDHQSPEGKLITEKMNADGVKYMTWGENIIYRKGQINVNELAEHFMERWMNSPGHRANILSDKFKTIGVGLYRIGDAVYGTQEFCK